MRNRNMVEHSASIMPLMHMLVYVYMHVYEEHVLYARATNVHVHVCVCKCNLHRLPSIYKHVYTHTLLLYWLLPY